MDSILAQIFTDYEVIIVDDCSTYSSCKIVESYMPKFKLIKSKINSGGAGTPRNIGIRYSRGDYIFFMDSDDAMTANALSDLYKTAKDFQADVVHCDKCYQAEGESVTTDITLLKEVIRTREVITKPTPLSNNLDERVKKFIDFEIKWEPWDHLISRDLIVKHDLKFSNLSIADDLLFGFYLMCLAEKVIVIPNTFYVWRIRQVSNSKGTLDLKRQMHRRGGDIIKGLVLINKFVDKFELFQRRLDYRYVVFDFFTRAGGIHEILHFYQNVHTAQLYELIRHEMSESEGDISALMAFFFSRNRFGN